MYNGRFNNGTVGILRIQQELKAVTGRKSIQILFELGQESAGTKKEGQGILRAKGRDTYIIYITGITVNINLILLKINSRIFGIIKLRVTWNSITLL